MGVLCTPRGYGGLSLPGTRLSVLLQVEVMEKYGKLLFVKHLKSFPVFEFSRPHHANEHIKTMWFGDFSVFRLPHWIPGRFLGPFPPTYGYLEPQALACHRLRWDLCRMMLGCHDLYMTLSWLWKLWNHENRGSKAFKPWFVGGFPTITLPCSPYRDPWASLTTHAVVGAGPFIGHTSCDINVTCMGEGGTVC